MGRLASLVALVVALVASLLLAAPPAAAQLPCDLASQFAHSGYATVSRPPRYEIGRQEVLSIPGRIDGAAIQIGIVRPEVPAGTRVPVIVDASPYYHPLQTLDLRACRPHLTENFVPQGYAVALVAVRGTADSGGCMDLFGPRERADLDQAISWLGTRDWSSGAVGMTGLSYDGSTPWMVAATGNPHLKTIVPVSGVNDVFQLLYGGGTPDWRGPAVFNSVYYAQSVGFYLPGRSPEHTVEVIACPDYAVGTAASAHSSLTGELDPFGFWAARRYRPAIEANYRGSVLLVQGLQDWNVNPGAQFPWVNELEGRIHLEYLLGQWDHTFPDFARGDARRADYADLLLAWFDRWLYGDRSADLGAVAEVQDSQGRWRRVDHWPPRGEEVAFYLTPATELTTSASATSASRPLVPTDPVRNEFGVLDQLAVPADPLASLETGCPAPICQAFASPAFDEEFHFAGSPQLRLPVLPAGPGGQVSVRLYAVGPQRAQRLAWGQFDLRFPAGRDSEPVAQRVSPGEQVLLNAPLQPADAVVPAGWRLVLVASQGSAYNRVPAAPVFPVSLVVGGPASAITVNRVEPAAGTFFDPP